MAKLEIRRSVWESMTDSQKEVFTYISGRIRLGIPTDSNAESPRPTDILFWNHPKLRQDEQILIETCKTNMGQIVSKLARDGENNPIMDRALIRDLVLNAVEGRLSALRIAQGKPENREKPFNELMTEALKAPVGKFERSARSTVRH